MFFELLIKHYIYRASIPLENDLDMDSYRRASRVHDEIFPKVF